MRGWALGRLFRSVCSVEHLPIHPKALKLDFTFDLLRKILPPISSSAPAMPQLCRNTKKRKVCDPPISVGEYHDFVCAQKIPEQPHLSIEGLQGSNDRCFSGGGHFIHGAPSKNNLVSCGGHGSELKNNLVECAGYAAQSTSILGIHQVEEALCNQGIIGKCAAQTNAPTTVNGMLNDCMQSVLGELREGGHKLLQWLRQEMQSIPSGLPGGKRGMLIGREDSESRDVTHDNGLQLGFSGDKSVQQAKLTTVENEVDNSVGDGGVDLQLLEGSSSKEGSQLCQTNDNNEMGLKVIPLQSKSDVLDLGSVEDESKGAQVNLQSSSPKGRDEYEVSKSSISTEKGLRKALTQSKAEGMYNGFDATMDEGSDRGCKINGSNIKEEIESSKESTDIHREPDPKSEVREIDTVFGGGLEEQSRKIDGFDANKHGTAYGTEEFLLSKAGNDKQKHVCKLLGESTCGMFHVGYGSCFAEKNHEGASLESGSNGRFDFGFSKASNGVRRGLGIPQPDSKNIFFDRRFTVDSRGASLEEESKGTAYMGGFVTNTHVTMMDNHPRERDCDAGAGFSVQCTQPGETSFVGEETYVYNRHGFGVESNGETGMTFKGPTVSRHEEISKDDMSSVELFNFMTSSLGASKLLGNASRLPAEDCKVGLLGMHNHSAIGEMSSPAHMNMMWDMLTSGGGRALNPPAMHEPKVFQLDHVSHSKLEDAVSHSGRTQNNAWYDLNSSQFNYLSHSKLENGDISAYQGQSTSVSMYPFSPCTSNTGIVPSINANLGMRLPSPRHNASIPSSSYMSLLGMNGPGAVQGASSMQTFLGLGMNGLPGASNNRHVFPDMNM